MNETDEELLDFGERKHLQKMISGIDDFCGGLHEFADDATKFIGGILMWAYGLGWAMSDAMIRRQKEITPIMLKESPHLTRILDLEDE